MSLKRRQLLKLLIPLAILPAGYFGLRSSLLKSPCELPDPATWLAWLKPFADAELAKGVSIEPPPEWWSVFSGACRDSFAEAYRARVAEDFAQGKTVEVDGWLLSETEAFTHRTVYR